VQGYKKPRSVNRGGPRLWNREQERRVCGGGGGGEVFEFGGPARGKNIKKGGVGRRDGGELRGGGPGAGAGPGKTKRVQKGKWSVEKFRETSRGENSGLGGDERFCLKRVLDGKSWVGWDNGGNKNDGDTVISLAYVKNPSVALTKERKEVLAVVNPGRKGHIFHPNRGRSSRCQIWTPSEMAGGKKKRCSTFQTVVR